MSYGRLIFKIDNSYDTSDSYVTDPTYDPCQADYPLFKCDGYSTINNCITHYEYNLAGGVSGASYGNSDPEVMLIDSVFVYKFMYFVVNSAYNDYNVILKATGSPVDGSLAVARHQDLYSG